MRLTGGGGSNKTAPKSGKQVDVFESLPALFHEAGGKGLEILGLIEDLISQVGMGRLRYLTQGDPTGRPEKFLDLRQHAGSELPLQSVAKLTETKLRKLQRATASKPCLKFDVHQIAMCDGHFENEDGAKTNIISSFSPFTTGTCALPEASLQRWLKGEPTLSGDELAVFVAEPCGGIVGFKWESFQVPVYDNQGNLRLVHGKLFQFGSKEVRVSKRIVQTEVTSDTKLLAFTLWQHDFDHQTWKDILEHPVRMAKKPLQDEGLSLTLSNPWGRRFRNCKGECPPAQAESVQFHALTSSAAYPAILKRLGWNRIFATPKGQAGQLLGCYRVIWVPQSAEELATKAKTIPGSRGLVRGRRSKGIRVDLFCFEEAWALLKPGQAVPELTPMKHHYRVEPFPHGVDRLSIQRWAGSYTWTVRPVD